MWDGRIYLGTRGGHLFILGDASLAATETSTTAAGATSSTTASTAYADVGD